MNRSWEEVVTAKRLERNALIERHCDSASGLESHTRITDIADVDTLTHLIESRALTAETVTRAYIQR